MNYHAQLQVIIKKTDFKHSVKKMTMLLMSLSVCSEWKSNYDYHYYCYSFSLCFPSQNDNGLEVKLNICLQNKPECY